MTFLSAIFLFLPSLFAKMYFMVAYVSNVNSFLRPLSSEEELLYLQRMDNGDIEAKNKLIEHNMRLVVHVVKKYTSTGKELDDLISIGTIGLIKGINTFNYKKGTKLATYVARCIENEILMFIRGSKKSQSDISIEEPLGFDTDGNRITFNDILYNDGDTVLDATCFKIQIDKLYNIMKEILTPRELNVLIMRFGLQQQKEMTQREIAKILKISRSYVSRIEKRAVNKIRKHADKNNYTSDMKYY